MCHTAVTSLGLSVQVILERMAQLDCLALTVSLVLLDSPASWVILVLPVEPEVLELWDCPVLLERPARRGLRDRMAAPERPEALERPDCRVLREIRDPVDQREQLEQGVKWGIRAPQVRLDQVDHLGQLASQVRRDLPEKRAPLQHQEQQVRALCHFPPVLFIPPRRSYAICAVCLSVCQSVVRSFVLSVSRITAKVMI